MLPRKIMAAASVSHRTMSMARTLPHLQIGRPISLAREMYFSSKPHGMAEDDGAAGNSQDQQQSLEKISDDGSQQTPRHPKPRRSQQKYNESERAIADKKKWRAPFWLPPPSKGNQNPNHGRKRRKPPRFEKRSANRFRDAILPCRNHLDPNNSMGLPTSDWVQIFGALPMTSLEEVLDSIENILRQEVGSIVDLDTDWNPHQDGEDPPLLPSILEVPIEEPQEWREYALDKDVIRTSSNDDSNTTLTQIESFRVVKAHVVLSPFGRPTGWNLQLANPSMVHALLSASQNARVKGTIKIGWKFARIKEYVPPLQQLNERDTRTMLVISDSMVRFENCPRTLTEDYLRHMLSRYELTPLGSTIIQWKGKTNDGKLPPLTFVVRFASPAYARAAVREMQGKMLEGRPMKLIQYPRQLL
mmetsp:Transcript_19247/g.47917  ORF Transcript_19247/g.47917 Transcript_19247/m.47917 type:complete len:416 (+) Transcript_19247:110-1357(+)